MKPTETPLRRGTLQRLLAERDFFDQWTTTHWSSLESGAAQLNVPAGCTLLQPEDLNPFAFFLVDGDVELAPAQGAPRTVNSAHADAQFPLAYLRPSQYRVTTLTPCRLVRLELATLKRHAVKQTRARFREQDTVVSGSWQNHGLAVDVLRRERTGKLAVPAIPGVALRIRRALAKPECSMQDVGAVVSADPVIAARLLKVANSAVFGGQSKSDSLQSALVRLGVDRTQSLVLSIATKGLFVSNRDDIKQHMMARWRHAIEIAALCSILAKLTPGLNADQGLLVGLLHEIGAIPILRAAESYHDLKSAPTVLDDLLSAMTPRISTSVLGAWQFSPAFAEAAWMHRDFYYDHEGDADYTDVLIVAHVHDLVKRKQFDKLPRLDETPAFARLALGKLSPDLSLEILEEASAQVKELRDILH